MVKIKYSIVCDYCSTVFCDEIRRHDFEGHELQSKFQEAKNRGWEVSPIDDYSAHVTCDKCKERHNTRQIKFKRIF